MDCNFIVSLLAQIDPLSLVGGGGAPYDEYEPAAKEILKYYEKTKNTLTKVALSANIKNIFENLFYVGCAQDNKYDKIAEKMMVK